MSQGASARQTVLLVGNYCHTLTVVRSLGAAGHHVIVGRGGPTWGEELSRFAAEVWDHPSPNADREFIGALTAFLGARRDVTAVFPMGDLDTRCLGRHADALRGLTTLVMPDPAIVEMCQDKTHMLRLADELEVPHTRDTVASDYGQLLAAADAVGYPCIVKPSNPSLALLGRKAVICRTATALRERFPAWPAPHASLLVEGYALGLRHNHRFAAANGRILRHVENLTLRTDALDGTGLITEGITVAPSPRLMAYTERIVRRLGYTGVGHTQFIVDESTGAVCFLELNSRLPGGTAFDVRAGLDLPLLALALAGRTPLPPLAGQATRGVRYAWTSRDLSALISAVRSGEVTPGEALRWLWRIVRTAVTADVHCTWRWDDPLPVLAYQGRRLGERLKKVVNHGFRRRVPHKERAG
jgi:predicted ATP-grasp superfamily ATP-dependent carboligase